jgi:hypothetical protein
VKLCKILIAAVLGNVLLSGCQTVPYESGTPFQDNALAEELRENVNNLYPSSLRALHRCVLTVGDMELELTGYILARRPADIRLVAMSDFGGTLFEILHNSKNGTKVIKNTVGFRRKWLTKGALRDVDVIYLKHPSSNATLVRHRDNVIGLIEELRGRTLEEFYFDGNTHALIGYTLVRDGNYLYEVSFSNNKIIPGWPQPVPKTIEIKDYRMNYQLIINVMKFSPDQLKERFFD